MFANIRLLIILTALNLLATAGIGWWVYTKHNNAMDVDNLENLLEELAENNPHFLVSLLNEAANESVEHEEDILETNAFTNKVDILKAGFSVKIHQNVIQKTLVVFVDMANAHSLTYLKNVQMALANLNCSVRVIPVSMFGGKSTEQAKLITAASLQSEEKAFQLALTYNTVEGAENIMMKSAEKLGLNIKKLSQDMQAKAVSEAVANQTKLAENLMIPGVPCMILLTIDKAYVLPPVEAKDLPILIEHPTAELADELP